MSLVVALVLSVQMWAAPVCSVGNGSSAWSGSPADLAGIEAVYQREQAQKDNRAYPQGAPEPSPWSALVACRER